MQEVNDIIGDWRFGELTGLKEFIQPHQAQVRETYAELTEGLHTTEEIIDALWDYVGGLRYRKDEGIFKVPGKTLRARGELFLYPQETILVESGDCDDKAILLTSLLRNTLPAEEVRAVVGFHGSQGHMWVEALHPLDGWVILESVRRPNGGRRNGNYEPVVAFNDQTVLIYTEEEVFPMTSALSPEVERQVREAVGRANMVIDRTKPKAIATFTDYRDISRYESLYPEGSRGRVEVLYAQEIDQQFLDNLHGALVDRGVSLTAPLSASLGNGETAVSIEFEKGQWQLWLIGGALGVMILIPVGLGLYKFTEAMAKAVVPLSIIGAATFLAYTFGKRRFA